MQTVTTLSFDRTCDVIDFTEVNELGLPDESFSEDIECPSNFKTRLSSFGDIMG